MTSASYRKHVKKTGQNPLRSKPTHIFLEKKRNGRADEPFDETIGFFHLDGLPLGRLEALDLFAHLGRVDAAEVLVGQDAAGADGGGALLAFLDGGRTGRRAFAGLVVLGAAHPLQILADALALLLLVLGQRFRLASLLATAAAVVVAALRVAVVAALARFLVAT